MKEKQLTEEIIMKEQKRMSEELESLQRKKQVADDWIVTLEAKIKDVQVKKKTQKQKFDEEKKKKNEEAKELQEKL